MQPVPSPSRREVLLAAGAVAVDPARAVDPPGKVYRIGVASATIGGKPQRTNGHTWHFAQYLHPTIDLDAIKKFLDPGSSTFFSKVVHHPAATFGQLPFPDTRITHYYSTDRQESVNYCQAFPGVKPAKSLEEMAAEVDGIWVGDASGRGEDHFDLVAPGLARGLPTFCDKPIGGSVKGTQKILAFAEMHKAPIMSASLFRYEWGMEHALRLRDAKEFGPIEHVSARLYGRYNLDAWMIYGQHPVWSVMTLQGPGVEAVSLYEHKDTCHGLITYPDRYPCHVWYGQPFERFEYNRTDVYFQKKLYTFTPSIEGDFWFGHHYEMFRMAATFRDMVRTRKEPVPHREILEVTAIIHAGAKSLKEKSRLVALAEMMG
jgi:predicted dehydrogenase